MMTLSDMDQLIGECRARLNLAADGTHEIGNLCIAVLQLVEAVELLSRQLQQMTNQPDAQLSAPRCSNGILPSAASRRDRGERAEQRCGGVNEIMPKLAAGWDVPDAARTAHYFPADSEQSLCKRWFVVGYRSLPGAASDEDYSGARCQKCERKRARKAARRDELA